VRRGRAAALLGAALAAAFPSSGRAHTQSESLDAGAERTDFFQVLCTDDGAGAPASLVLQVLDAAPAASPLVSALVRRGALVAATTDAVDGDTTASPQIAVDGGGGTYDVLVSKSAAGAEAYTLTFHCMTGPGGSGGHTGTSIFPRQDQ
jgi:hypothetical protein